MLKRVDVAAHQTLRDAMDGKFTSGVISLGLAENGVDWALDEFNASLVSPDVKAAVEKAKADIISGAIQVHNYETDQTCPF
jgi:basic membrane protein A